MFLPSFSLFLYQHTSLTAVFNKPGSNQFVLRWRHAVNRGHGPACLLLQDGFHSQGPLRPKVVPGAPDITSRIHIIVRRKEEWVERSVH